MKPEDWNWQIRESKYGAESDISSQYDIISHKGDITSEDDVKSVGKGSTKGRSKTVNFEKPTPTPSKRIRFPTRQFTFPTAN